MAFTVRDFKDLIRLLDEHPEWLETLRQRLLTKELLGAPKTLRGLSARVGRVGKGVDRLGEAVQALTQSVASLAEAQRRTEEALAAHRAETDRRFAELAEAIQRLTASFEAHRQEFLDHRREFLAHREEFSAHRAETDRRFAELAEAVRRLAEAFEAHREEFLAHRAEAERRFAELAEAQQELIRHQRQMQTTLDRFAQVIGPAVEERMVPALREWVEGQGGRLLGPVVSMALDGIGEVDGVVRVRGPEGREGWVLVTVKAKVWPRGVREFVEGILQNAAARDALRAEGVGDPVWPVVFGLTADARALEAAEQAKVGLLLSGQGMIIPPVP